MGFFKKNKKNNKKQKKEENKNLNENNNTIIESNKDENSIKDESILKVDELKELAKEKGLKNYSTMNKLELVICLWRNISKPELESLTKDYFDVKKTSSMNKRNMVEGRKD